MTTSSAAATLLLFLLLHQGSPFQDIPREKEAQSPDAKKANAPENKPEQKCPEGPDVVPWPSADEWELDSRYGAVGHGAEDLVQAKTMHFQSSEPTEAVPPSQLILCYAPVCSAKADLLFFWRHDTDSTPDTSIQALTPTYHLLVKSRDGRILFNAQSRSALAIWRGLFYDQVNRARDNLRKKQEKEDKKKRP